MNNGVGELIRTYRTGLGLTQTDLAEASGVKREYISSAEQGRIQVIYPEPLRQLQRVLGFPGWVALEAMGYGVWDDARSDSEVVAMRPPHPGALKRALLWELQKLRPRQQDILLEFMLLLRRFEAAKADEEASQ